MPALNPSYAQQQANPLPVIFGVGFGQGYRFCNYVDPKGNIFKGFVVSDGEIDGFYLLAGTSNSGVHFHSGAWTPLGTPPNAGSVGFAQGYDASIAAVPTVTPPQSLSGMSYYATEQSPPSGFYRGTYTPLDITPFGIFRGARCRRFDSSGNVIAYGFTSNPTWHIIEALLRWKFKVQQPQIAGLTTAEKALFNWPSIVAHAARNATIIGAPTGIGFTPLSVGPPRFMGNYTFASDGTLAAMLETMLRSCRSYLDDPNGQIGIYGFDDTLAGFALTNNHILPGSFQCSEKDVTTSPNVFVPQYRDLNLQAIATVNSATANTGGYSDGDAYIPNGAFAAYFDTGGVNPFQAGNSLVYAGGSNPAWSGFYNVAVNDNPSDTDPLIICNTVPAGVVAGGSSNGGYVAGMYAMFQPKAPTSVQHRQHQKAVNQIAPGVPGLPKVVPVTYDLGNGTYDQTNRLMQYLCVSSLGPDVPGWRPPLSGSVRIRWDAVDAFGNRALKLRPNEGDRGDGRGYGRISIDDTVSPEFAGEYIIKKLTYNKEDYSIDVEFTEFFGAAAYPDTSYPEDAANVAVPCPYLTMMGTGLPANASAYTNLTAVQGLSLATPYLTPLGTDSTLSNVAWCLQATVDVGLTSVGATTADLTVQNLVMQILGRTAPTTYPAAFFSAVPKDTAVTLYVVDDGVDPPTFGWVATPVVYPTAIAGIGLFTGPGIPAGSPASWYAIMSCLQVSATGKFVYL